uniref:Uncharacterized protein n=1 Tax=Panagrolaimus davidi TaxID=227884 RepID=A0A914PFM3_9BILA
MYSHVYFYGAVQLISEKTEVIMNVTVTEEIFASDGILGLVKFNLKSVATDGASVMLRIHTGLKPRYTVVSCKICLHFYRNLKG